MEEVMVIKSPGGGRFFPSDEEEVFSFIKKNMLENVVKTSKIVLSPHAGYVYSGETAAMAISYLERNFETAVIIATAHTVESEKPSVVKNAVFEGVYGRIETDDELIDFLLKKDVFKNNPSAFIHEHSVDVILPFLKYLKKDFKIVPLVVNGENKEILKKTAIFLKELSLKKNIVFIISSDLSHYPPYDVAYASDNAIAFAYDIAIRNGDVDYFYLTKELLSQKYSNYLDTVACGFSPMTLGLFLALEMGYNSFEVAKYTNSGMIADKGSVVGYLGGFFARKEIKKDFIIELIQEEKKELLIMARKSIESYIKEKKVFKENILKNPKFNLPFAVFVTLTKDGDLRGCIGSLLPHMLLGDAVCEYSVKAAFNDPRFDEVSLDELKKIKIEISILSPLRRIKNISEIREKIDGVYVKRGFRSGTYLPQVWEHFEKKEDFLRSLFDEKSGIGYEHLNASDTEIYTYTVLNFSESH
jgi:AmmeMemoRadiSam system protein B/AmmeMemoRadiSam system protein A